MFITLSDGNTTHYEFLGAEGAPLVVLVHGISIPMYSWEHIAPQLAHAGFRVLRYDVYGRGESAYPLADYDRNLLMGQLTGLLGALVGEQERVNLVGFSFGGAMAALFASLYCPHVDRLALVSPFARMPPQLDTRKTMRLPLVGELLMRFKLKPALQARAARLLAAAGLPADNMRKFEAQLARPEFARAFLSLLRSNALDPYGPAYASVAASGMPTALAWGTGDEDITAESMAYTREALKPRKYLEVPGATHGGILMDGGGLVSFLLDFLREPLPEPPPAPVADDPSDRSDRREARI